MTEYKFDFPFKPYPIQQDLTSILYSILKDGGVGVCESPTGTGKSMSIACASVKWLTFKPPKKNEEPDWLASWAPAVSNSALERELSAPWLVYVYTDIIMTYSSRNDDGDLAPWQQRLLDIPAKDKRVIYCSRTHTQLKQYTEELRRVHTASKLVALPLASRVHCCINDEIRGKPIDMMTELCNAARTRDTDGDGDGESSNDKADIKHCPYSNMDAVSKCAEFLGTYSAERSCIHDIEDVVTVGKSMKACPYYAMHHAAHGADVLLVPYNLVFSDQITLPLTSNDAVIIDEAHNLNDAITNMHSANVTEQQMSLGCFSLESYTEKYGTRFGPETRNNIAKLMKVIKTLLGHFTTVSTDNIVYDVNAFLDVVRLKDVNISALVSWLYDSKTRILVRVPQMVPVANYLRCMSKPDSDGIVIMSRGKSRYVSMDCSRMFQKIVSSTKALLLVGGTLSPFGSMLSQLFHTNEFNDTHALYHKSRSKDDDDDEDYVANVEIPSDLSLSTSTTLNRYKFSATKRHENNSGSERTIVTSSCSHVVSRDRVFLGVLDSAPGNQCKFQFTHQTKNDMNMIDNLGNIIITISSIVPRGMVVFVTSYAYLDMLTSRWRSTGAISRMESHKKLFIECSGSSGTLLTSYESTINRGGCALLFAVMSGSLSEGINFKDDLGRCVVVIGMPYPNITDPETKARVNYVTKLSEAGQYLDDVCMRSVNQSVGRAIRHVNDYAAVLLVDTRYRTPKVFDRLPKWLSASNVDSSSFEQACSSLKGFYDKFRQTP